VIVLPTALAVVALLLSDWPARFLVLEDPTTRADAAIVFAGDPDYERTSHASRLLLEGRVRLLVLTGGEPGPGDSAASLRERALALGVEPGRIRSEEVSRSTREALVAVAPILQREGVTRVALVSSPYHQRRAFLAARRTLPGLTILNWPATPSSWSPHRWWSTARSRRIVFSEYGKLVVYAGRGWLCFG
jgi:uncharacterized SAM-binding protein YcdF (DUF218 family)